MFFYVKTNNVIDEKFKENTLMEYEKNVIQKEIECFLDDKKFLRQISVLQKRLSDKTENIIAFASVLYPDKNIREAVSELFQHTQNIAAPENIKLKSIRTDKKTIKKIADFKLNKNFIAKTAYLKILLNREI